MEHAAVYADRAASMVKVSAVRRRLGRRKRAGVFSRGHFLFLDGIYEAAKGNRRLTGWALLVGDTVGPVLFASRTRPVSRTGYAERAVTRLTFGDRSVDSIGFRTFPLRTRWSWR
jgi:hypothetical protein